MLKKKEDLLIEYLENKTNINNEETYIINIDDKTTEFFLRNLKLLYAEKIGGGHSDDEIDQIYDDIQIQEEYDYISYDNIKKTFKQKRELDQDFVITNNYLESFTYILGFTHIFRFSGLFENESKSNRKIQNIYHLLQYYPYGDTIEKQTKFINKIFSDTSKILLEIVEILLENCENYTEIKQSPKKDDSKKKSPKKDDTSNLRRSSRLKT